MSATVTVVAPAPAVSNANASANAPDPKPTATPAAPVAAPAVAVPDPYFTSGGKTYRFVGVGACAGQTNCTESTTPIQAALDSAAKNKPDDGAVYVEGGTYKENVTLQNLSSITVRGAANNSTSTIAGRVSILNSLSIWFMQFTVSNGIVVDNSQNVTVSDVKVTNAGGEPGIKVTNSSNVALNNVAANNVADGGAGAALSNNSGKLSITNSQFNNNSGAGLVVENHSGEVHVNDVEARENARGPGIQVVAASPIYVSNVVARNNAGAGAELTMLSPPGIVSVQASAFTRNNGPGLEIKSAGSVTLEDLTALENAASGALVSGLANSIPLTVREARPQSRITIDDPLVTLNAATIQFAGVSALALEARAGGALFNVYPSARTALSVDGGAGAAMLYVDVRGAHIVTDTNRITAENRRPIVYANIARTTIANIDPEITASQQQTLTQGLQAFADWGKSLAAYGEIAQVLPMVNQSISNALDLANTLLQLRNHVNAAFTSGVTTTEGLVTDLAAWNQTSGNLQIAASSVSGGVTVLPGGAEQLAFTLEYSATRTLPNIPINLGANATALGLGLDASAAVTLSANLNTNLTFGADLAAGLTVSDSFFVRVNQFAVTATVHATDLNFGVTLGGAALGVQNGAISLTAVANVGFVSPNADGSITLAQLITTPLANLVVVTPTGALSAELPLAAAAPGLASFNFGNPIVIVFDNNLFDSQAPEISIDVDVDALKDRVLSILDSLASQAAGFASAALLDYQIPLLTTSLNDIFQLDNLLALRDAALAYYNTAGAHTASGLASALVNHVLAQAPDATGNSSDGPVSILGTLDALANELRFDLLFDMARALTLPLALPSNAGAVGLTLNASVMLLLLASLKVNLSFGIKLNGGLLAINDESTFVKVNQILIQGSARADNIGVGATISGTSMAVLNGTAALTAAMNITFTDPNADGRITVAELKRTSFSSLANFTPDGSLYVRLPLDRPVPGFDSFNFGNPIVIIRHDHIFGGTLPDLSLDIAVDGVKSNLLSLLDRLDIQSTNILGLTSLDSKLPILNLSVNELFGVRLGDLLNLQNARAYLNAAGAHTLGGLLDALLAQATTQIPDATGNLAAGPFSVSGGLFALQNEARLTIAYNLTRVVTVPLDFGAPAKDLGLFVDESERLVFSATLTFKLTLGVFLAADLAADDRGFARFDPLVAGVALHTNDLAFDAAVGFLGVTVDGGALNLDVGATIAFKDPNGDGAITVREFKDTKFNQLVTLTPSGAVSAVLPISGSLGSFNTNAFNPQLTISNTNFFKYSTEYATSNFALLLDFTNLSSAQVLALYRQLITTIGNFGRASGLYNVPIPFVVPTTVDDVLDLSAAYTTKVVNYIMTETPDGKALPKFNTAQELIALLTDVVGIPRDILAVNYDTTTKELTFGIRFAGATTTLTKTIDFAFNLGDLSTITSTNKLTITGSYSVSFVYGLVFTPIADPVIPYTMSDNIAKHAFLEGARADVTLTVSGPVTGSVNYGFVGLDIDGGAALVTGTFGLTITNPTPIAGHPSRISLYDLANGLADPTKSERAKYITQTFQATGGMNLPVFVNGFDLGDIGSPHIVVTVTDLKKPALWNVDISSLWGVFDFKALRFRDILIGFQGIVEYLDLFDSYSYLGYRLPLLNKSASDIVGYIADLTQKLNAANKSQANLQTLDDVLNTVLGLNNRVAVEYDRGTHSLRVVVTYTRQVTGSFLFNLDLNALIDALPADDPLLLLLEGASNLIDVSDGLGNLAVAAGVTATLALGMNLTQPVTPTAFLFDDTEVSLYVKATGSSLNFTGTIGSLSVVVKNGTAMLGLDNTGDPAHPSTVEPLQLHAGFAPTATHRYTFTQLSTSVLALAFTGSVSTTMALSVDGVEIGDLIIAIGQLNDISGTLAMQSPDLASEIASVQILEEFPDLIGGLDELLQILQDALDNSVFGMALPLIGSFLSEQDDGSPVRFSEKLRDSVTKKLRQWLCGDENADVSESCGSSIELVQKALFAAFGPGGFIPNIMLFQKDAAGNYYTFEPNGTVGVTTTLTHKSVVFEKTKTSIQFNLHLGQTLVDFAVRPNFDLGFPGLGLSVKGELTFVVKWEFYLGFGISIDDGFFFDPVAKEWDPTSESLVPVLDPLTGEPVSNVNIEIRAGVSPDFKIVGTLAFLQISGEANPDPTKPTALLAAFRVSLKDPDDNGRLTFAELVSADFSELITYTVVARADVNLHLVGSFGGSAVFPSIHTDFIVQFEFNTAKCDGACQPYVAFENVELDLGTFFSDFARPILKVIQDILKPVMPVIDFLYARIPVLSDIPPLVDLMDGDEDGAVSLRDIMAMLYPKINWKFIDQVRDVINIINSIPVDAATLRITLVKKFVILDDLGEKDAKDVDLNDSDAVSITLPTDSARDQAEGASPGAAKFFAALAKSESADDSGSGDGAGEEEEEEKKAQGLKFDILQNPINILKALMGQTVTVFTYEMEPFSAGLDYTLGPFKILIPNAGPLGISFRFGFNVEFKFAFGFDTFGLSQYVASVKTCLNEYDVADCMNPFSGEQYHKNPIVIFDGFYVSTRENPDGTGEEAWQVGFYGEISVLAGLSIGIPGLLQIDAGVYGGIGLTIQLGLNDYILDDGKFRISEMLEIMETRPWCLFKVAGKMECFVGAYIGVTVLGIKVLDLDYEFARVTLFEFEFKCEPEPPPDLGTFSNGTLTLYVGSTMNNVGGKADYNKHKIDIIDGGILTTTNAQMITVSAYGLRKDYVGVTRVIALADKEDWEITVGPGVFADATLTGGTGTVKMSYSGMGNTWMRAGSGVTATTDMRVANCRVDETSYDKEIRSYYTAQNALCGTRTHTFDYASSGGGDATMVGGPGNNVFDARNIASSKTVTITFGKLAIRNKPERSTTSNSFFGGAGTHIVNLGADVGDGYSDLHLGSGVHTLNWEKSNAGAVIDVIAGVTVGTNNLLSMRLSDDGNNRAILSRDALNPQQVKVDVQLPGKQTFTAIRMVGVQTLKLATGKRADEVTVNDLAGTDLTFLSLDLGQTAGADNRADTLTINTTTGADNVTLSVDAAQLGAPPAAIRLAGLQYLILIYGTDRALDTLALNTLEGDDHITIKSVWISTTVNSGIGDDRINVILTTDDNPIVMYASALDLNLSVGTDTLYVDDWLNTSNAEGTLTLTSITGLSFEKGLTYFSAEHVTITLGSANNTFVVQSTWLGSTTALYGGANVDTITVNYTAGTTLIESGAGADVITINGTTGDTTIDAGFDDDTITINDAGAHDYDQTSIYAGGGVDTINIYKTTGTTYISGGNSADNIIIHSTGGATTIDADAGDDNIVVHGTGGNTTLNAGDGVDTIYVWNTGAGATTTISGGDLLDYIHILGANGTVTVSGDGGDDRFFIWAVNGDVTVNGGIGEDKFFVSHGVTKATFFGANGYDDTDAIAALAMLTGTLASFTGRITLNGNAPGNNAHTDKMFFSDIGNNAASSAAASVGTLTNDSVSGYGMTGRISYSFDDGGTLFIQLGQNGKTMTVTSMYVKNIASIFGGNDDDTVTVRDAAQTLIYVDGIVSFLGQGGTDTLIADNRGDADNCPAEFACGQLTTLGISGLGMGTGSLSEPHLYHAWQTSFFQNGPEPNYVTNQDAIYGAVTSSTEFVKVLLGTGKNKFAIDSAYSYGTSIVEGNSDDDIFRVEATPYGFHPDMLRRVQYIAGTLQVIGGGGNDLLILNDSGNDAMVTGTLSASSGFSGLKMTGSISASAGMNVEVALGAAKDNAFYLRSSPVNVKTTIVLGGAFQYAYVGNSANSLDDFKGTVVISGYVAAPTDALYIYDQGDTSNNSYVITSALATTLALGNGGTLDVYKTTLARTGIANITYSGFEYVSLNAGLGNDTIDIQGVHRELDALGGRGAVLVLNAGGGDDTITVGEPQPDGTRLLDNFDIPVIVNGGSGWDSVTFDHSGSTISSTLAFIRQTFAEVFSSQTMTWSQIIAPLANETVTATLAANFTTFVLGKVANPAERVVDVGLYARDVDDVGFNLGSGDDVFRLASGTYDYAMTVDGGPGNDTINVDRVAVTQQRVTFNGGPGDDIVFINFGLQLFDPQKIDNTVTNLAATALTLPGNTLLASGVYTVAVQGSGASAQFRLVDSTGAAVEIALVGGTTLTTSLQTVPTGAYDTGRGLLIDFGTNAAQFKAGAATLTYDRGGVPNGTLNLAFNGGSEDTTGDLLRFAGDGIARGEYRISATQARAGTITIKGNTFAFTGVEPLVVAGFGGFDVIAPDVTSDLAIETINLADLGLKNIVLHSVTVDGVLTWRQQVKIAGTVALPTQAFGRALAVTSDGVYLAVSAYMSGTYEAHGVVYIYTQSGGLWTEEAKIISTDPSIGITFGSAIAIDGTTLVVGDYGDDAMGVDAGAAYIYQRAASRAAWLQQVKLTAADGAAGARFGASVAINGGTVVIGAPGAANSTGAVYIFGKSGSIWMPQAKLTASDGAANDQFGAAVAVKEPTIAVGAPFNGGNGAVYVYVRGATWVQQGPKLGMRQASGADDPFGTSAQTSVYAQTGEQFGAVLAMSANTRIVIGAPMYDSAVKAVDGQGNCTLGCDVGAAFVFDWVGYWKLVARLTSDDGLAETEAQSENRAFMHFGASVAADGAYVAVGAPDYTANSLHEGAVYLFYQLPDSCGGCGSTWTRARNRLTAPDYAENNRFGKSIVLRGTTLVIGMPEFDDASGSPAVPVQWNVGTIRFYQTNGAISLNDLGDGTIGLYRAEYMNVSTGSAQAGFKTLYHPGSHTLLVGAPGDSKVYVFVDEGLYWRYHQTLGGGGQFGYDMDLSGDTLVVGAPGANALDIFTYGNGFWNWAAVIWGPSGSSGFGTSVAIDGGRIAVGAPWTWLWYKSNDAIRDSITLAASGAVFTYWGGGSSWSPERFIMLYDSGMPDSTFYWEWVNPWVTVYSDINYGTPSYTWYWRTIAECANINVNCNPNVPHDYISSVKVGPNTKITFWSDADWGGPSWSYTSDQSSMGDYNDWPSAMRLNCIGTDDNALCGFQKPRSFSGLDNAAFGSAVELVGGTVYIGAAGKSRRYSVNVSDGGYSHWSTNFGTPLRATSYGDGYTSVDELYDYGGIQWNWNAHVFAGSGSRFIYGDTLANGNQGVANLYTCGAWGCYAGAMTSGMGGSIPYFGHGPSIVSDGHYVIGTYAANKIFNYRQLAPEWTPNAAQLSIIPDRIPTSKFGASVALDGMTAVAGAPMYDNRGAAFVFTRDSETAETWSLQARVQADDIAKNDAFGQAVSIHGDTVLIGAPTARVSGNANQGAAYLFDRVGTQWIQQTKLSAGGAGGLFGSAVDLNYSTAIVGAPGGNAAYIYTGGGANWTLQQTLSGGSQFGAAVAVNGNTAIVGAPAQNSNQGAATIYARSGGTWSAQTTLTGAASNDLLGTSVDIEGTRAVVGAPGANKAYVYAYSGAAWGLQQTLSTTWSVAGDKFGQAVAISGPRIVVGAQLATVTRVSGGQTFTYPGEGSAYAYGFKDNTWRLETIVAPLIASDGWKGDNLGSAVAINGTLVIAGAPQLLGRTAYDPTAINTDGAGYLYITELGPPMTFLTSEAYEILLSGAKANGIGGTVGAQTSANFRFFDMPSVSLTTGAANDTITLPSTGLNAVGLTNFSINTGAGNDAFTINAADLRLPTDSQFTFSGQTAGKAIGADLTQAEADQVYDPTTPVFSFDGGTGSDTLSVNADIDMNLSATRLKTSQGTLQVANLENANLTGGASSNVLYVGALIGVVNLDGKGGSDAYTLFIGNLTGGSVDDSVPVANGEINRLSVVGGEGEDAIVIELNTITINYVAAVHYSNIQSLSVGSGGGDDLIVANATSAGALTLGGEGGAVTYKIGNLPGVNLIMAQANTGANDAGLIYNALPPTSGAITLDARGVWQGGTLIFDFANPPTFGGAAVTGIGGVNLALTGGPNTINITALPTFIPFALTLGPNDTVNVGSLATLLSNVAYDLRLFGSTGNSTLNLNLSDNSSGTVTGEGITGFGMPSGRSVRYYDMGAVNLNLNNNNNTLDIPSSPSAGTMTINAGSGNDTFNVGSASNTLGGIGNLTINAGGGSDTLNLNDTGDSESVNGWVTHNTIAGFRMPGTITYSGVDTWNLSLGSGANTVGIDTSDTGFAGTNNIYGGTGGTATTATLGSSSGAATFNLNGNGAASNSLGIIGASSGSNFNVGGTTITSGATTFNSTNVGPFTLNAVGGANNIVLTSPVNFSSIVVNGGTGADTVDLTAFTGNATINGGAGTTTVYGTNGGANTWTLTANNAGNLNGVATFTSVEVIRGGTGADTLAANSIWHITGANAGDVDGVAFTAIENLQGAAHDDLFYFSGSGSVSGWVEAGAGANTFDYSGYGSAVTFNVQTSTATGVGATFANIQNLIGSPQSDTLVGANSANVWNVTGANAGNIGSILTFASFENLMGGSANDTFSFSGSAGVAGAIDGKAGSNTFDYSGYGSAVTFDLQNHTASGVGATWANIQNLVGSPQSDTFIASNIANTWNVTGTNAGNLNTALYFSGVENLTGNANSDTFIFGDGAGITGALNAAGGANTLDYAAYATARALTLTGTSTVGFAGATANIGGGFSNITSIVGSPQSDTLIGANIVNTWTLATNNAGNVNGALTFSSIETIAGSAASDTLIGANIANTWNVTGANAGNLNSALYFAGVENLTGSANSDAFIFSDGAGITGALNAAGGANTLNYAAYTTARAIALTATSTVGFAGTTANIGGGFSNITNLIGTPQADTLTGANIANTWNVTANNAGDVNGILTFTSFENLTGGSASDAFIFTDAKGVSGAIDGTSGANTLDYSNYLISRDIVLTAQTAVGFDGSTANIGGGFANINNLIGTAARDTLTGANIANLWALSGDDYSGTLNGALTFTSFETIRGGTGIDTLAGRNVANVWTLTPDNNSGHLNSALVFSSIEAIRGGAGGGYADCFQHHQHVEHRQRERRHIERRVLVARLYRH